MKLDMSRSLYLSFVLAITLLSGFVFGGATVNAAAINTSANIPSYKVQFATLVGTNSVNAACQGINLDNPAATDCPNNGDTSLHKLLNTVINILSVVVGIIAVIMIIVGGMKFITSGGEASKTASARNTILYAIVGLAIAALAQVVVHFVLNNVSS